MSEYSIKEQALIKVVGIPSEVVVSLTPRQVYQQMVTKCFMQDRFDGAIRESVRRCWRAYINGKIHRLTPEWDGLIDESILRPSDSTVTIKMGWKEAAMIHADSYASGNAKARKHLIAMGKGLDFVLSLAVLSLEEESKLGAILNGQS